MLEVSNLNKINPDSNSYLLDNMTFHIPKGHICGLIGENEAGKTTLISSVRSWLAIFFYPLFQFTNTLHRFLIHTVLHFTYRCYSVNCQ